MKRVFTKGNATNHKIVTIEVEGLRVRLSRKSSNGDVKRADKALKSEAAVRSECDRMVGELIAQGFVERASSGPRKPGKAKPTPAPEEAGLYALLEDHDQPADEAAPVLQRIEAPPTADDRPKKKKKGAGKKGSKRAPGGEELDKRVLGAVGAVGVVAFALVGYMAYDFFLKPPALSGVWRGSMVEFETGGPMSYMKYELLLDDAKRASMTLQEKFTSTGTYSREGDRLALKLTDKEGESSEHEYKIKLGRATLDLLNPESGKLVVQLIRFRETPEIGKPAPTLDAPKGDDLAADADPNADAKLASVPFGSKDGAFKLRHPEGWEAETGGRADNTYSWVRLTHGSAKIRVDADIQGSLMVGSNQSDHEEGSEFAPVHAAHELYQKTAAESYTDYLESEPTLFKGSGLGEGRIAAFTASGGGFGGSKIRGYRVTLLTNDRRINVLCDCPERNFEELKPTFLAVCRGVSR